LSGQRLRDNQNSTQLTSATISGRQWARDKPPRSSSNRAAARSDRPSLGPGPTRYPSCRCGDRLISTRRWRRPRPGRSGGHCQLMAHDKVGRIVRLKACRIIIGGLIATHRGRIFDLYAGRPASATPGCDRQRQRRGVGMLGSPHAEKSGATKSRHHGDAGRLPRNRETLWGGRRWMATSSLYLIDGVPACPS